MKKDSNCRFTEMQAGKVVNRGAYLLQEDGEYGIEGQEDWQRVIKNKEGNSCRKSAIVT